MATESTEEHENIYCKAFIFPCSSVDAVAIIKIRYYCAGGDTVERLASTFTR
jgi:hypothetical protein